MEINYEKIISYFFNFIFNLVYSFSQKFNKKNRRYDFCIKDKNIKDLGKNFESIKLENDYLSSTEKLLEFQNLYFDNELVKKDIQNIKKIYKRLNELEIKQLTLTDE